MKRILYIIALMLAVVGCAQNSVRFTLNATATELADSTVVVLYRYATHEPLDTTMVMDGKFTFSRTATEIEPLYTYPVGSAFIAENGVIEMHVAEHSTVGGTPLNDSIRKFRDAENELIQRIIAAQSSIADPAELERYIMEVEKPKMDSLRNAAFEANKTNPLGVIHFIGALINNPDKYSVQDIEQYFAEYPEAREYQIISQEYERLKGLNNTEVGQMFVDFTVRNIEDTAPAKLSDYVGRGQWVLLDFWASWCGPCLMEIPHLQEVMDLYGGENFTVVGVNVWDEHPKAIKEKGTKWPQIYSPAEGEREITSVAAQVYGIKGIPTLILFAPDGTITDRTLRGKEMIKIVGEKLKTTKDK